jgi:hypothetical protein
VSISQPYKYTSSYVRPLGVKELFPFRIKSDLNDLAFSDDEVKKRCEGEFEKLKSGIEEELDERGLDRGLALAFFLTHIAHISKLFPPRGVEQAQEYDSIESYYKNMEFAHCAHKSDLLYRILSLFSMYDLSQISYSNIHGWSHGFVELVHEEKRYIFCPTFNMFMDVGVEDFIDNPWCSRTILYLYSEEFYKSSLDSSAYEEYYQKRVDENAHTTIKYNRDWFAFTGFFPLIPPSHKFHRDGKEIYDVQKDNRFIFTK